jgi:gamma-glutamyl hydrolase
VPILIRQNDDYYQDMVKKTNGVLFPGGGRDHRNSDYRNAAEALFNYSMKANDRGEYYPIWGECLGFQLITILMAKYYIPNPKYIDGYWLTDCNAEDRAWKLNFTNDPRQTRLFANADENIINTLKTEDVTPNYHMKCITPKNFTDSKLINDFTVISTNRDDNGLEFISTYEHKSRPIYALQWHPEKIPFEFSVISKSQKPNKPQEKIPHYYNAVLIAQYMANFFVNETRKNNHSFGGIKEENKFIIYNYELKFTWKNKEGTEEDKGEYFSQMYEFNFNKGNTNRISFILGLCISAFVIIFDF